tara:strand:+ start:1833 stop:3236 length:1404 start_codon:yes stop_codon:yes gene_type:complete
LHWIDFLIISFFITGFPLYGYLQRKRNKTIEDYFLGGRNIPWYVAMMSIVATETSVLTFISVPGLSYSGNWTFLQLSLGYIIGRLGVSVLLLPIYFEKGVISIYQIIGMKFNLSMQRISSLVFLATRLLADGVRFLATAVIVQILTGWSIFTSIFIIGCTTLIYSFFGGIRSILWIDFFQFILYLFGGLTAIIIGLSYIELSFFDLFSYLSSREKLQLFEFSGNPIGNSYHFISALIGGIFLSLASHGIDHMMVQRVLSTKNLISARKAMIGSGILILFQFIVFLFVGSLIFILMGDKPIEQDREFTTFIIEYVPVGLRGLLLAGAISAAMSTLSSSINSLTTSTVVDIFDRNSSLKASKLISLLWGIVLMMFAFLFDETNSSLIEVGLRIASFTYGGLLGLFFLSKINLKINPLYPPLGLVSGMILVFFLDSWGFAWTWFVLISSLANVLLVVSLQQVENLFVSKS